MEQGLAYSGMIYRDVAEQLTEDVGLSIDAHQVIFIGFNALNNCEHKLFEYLKGRSLATFYWDWDEYYVDHMQGHEAGYFLRQNLRRYTPAPGNQSQSRINRDNKQVEIIETPTRISQASMVQELLVKNQSLMSNHPDCTAIVLADEGLMMPVLYNLPPDLEKVNITMGLPLKDTPVFSFIDGLIQLLRNASRSKSRIVRYLCRDVLGMLNHQFIKSLDIEGLNKLSGRVSVYHSLTISADELRGNEILEMVFPSMPEETGWSEYLMNILYFVFNSLSTGSESDKLEKEYIYRCYLMVKRMGEYIHEKKLILGADSFLRLLKSQVSSSRIPFSGEPLTGMQVMGILETRALDFSNVIILSMNEGILPKTSTASSMIPYNLRKGFGMLTIEHQDSIFAYYFYRIIQRAEKVWMIYNSEDSGLITGEPSRFIAQLAHETNYSIRKKSLAFHIEKSDSHAIEIEKTEAIIQQLNRYSSLNMDGRKLSPSALNTYLDCSLRFYFSQVARIREPDSYKEDMDQAMFGNILHRAMRFLYDPYLGRKLEPGQLMALNNDLPALNNLVLKAYMEDYNLSGASFRPEGRVRIILDIMVKYMKQFIKQDSEVAPLEIIALELPVESFIEIEQLKVEGSVRIGGTIDRIDRIGDRIRIIDYKTGKVEDSFPDVGALFRGGVNKRNRAALQTLIYCMVYCEAHSETNPVSPGLYFARRSFKSDFDYRLKIGTGKKNKLDHYGEIKSEVEGRVRSLVEEIFDMENTFKQTEEREICKYCPYIEICQRR
jgi:hypothetical protein